MPRVCFRLRVRADLLDEYRERHAAVPSEMLEAIRDSGRRDYSLFLDEDGLLVGIYETEDDAASRARLAADPRTAAWEAEMAHYFTAPSGATLDGRPDQAATQLPEIFHLETQLARPRHEGTTP
jgi:L-rhamnose mutarotase